MKTNVALLGLLLSPLTISNSSPDVLNAQGAPASTASLVASTIQTTTTTPYNKTDNTTTPYIDTLDQWNQFPPLDYSEIDGTGIQKQRRTSDYSRSRRRSASRDVNSIQEQTQRERGLSGLEIGAIGIGAFLGACICLSGVGLAIDGLQSRRATTNTQVDRTNTQVDSSQEIVENIGVIQVSGSTTPSSTISYQSSMTAETIGAELSI